MKRISLRFRLMILMTCLTTLPVVTVTWIATINTRESVEKEMIGANESRMLWADQYLSELIDQIDVLFYTLQINKELIYKMTAGLDDMNSDTQSQNHERLRDMLITTFFSNARKIDRLTLYSHSTEKALSVSYADSGTIRPLNIQGNAWRRTAKEPVSMYFKQTPEGINAFHSINRFPDKMFLGGISVGIHNKVWQEVVHILQSEADSYVFLMNDEGELLSGSTQRIASSEVLDELHTMDIPANELVSHQSEQYFYFMERIGDGQLTVVKVIPLSTVKASASPTIRAGMLTGGIFVTASILLSILFSLRITRPIISLARTMRKAQLQSFEMKSVKSFDEIGLLQHGYNLMMHRIKELIEHEYQYQIEVKNAQLLALQAQINPHFLNNTLNLIGGMALVKQAPEIYQITRIMGDLLRYSIRSENEMVSLQDEMTHTRNYLFIQEQRFAGRCHTVIETDQEVMDCLVPKFILQPLVENAFEHGLQAKEGAWHLHIRILLIDKRVIVMIKDDGVGVLPEKLALLRAGLRNGSDTDESSVNLPGPRRRRSIGLRNVHTRLRLHFGEAYGIRMFSKSMAGTLILMKLPYADNKETERRDS